MIAGPLVVFIGLAFGTGAFLTNSFSELTSVFMGSYVIGGLLSLIGSILLIGSVYRALVKIDALQVAAPSPGIQNWTAERR